VREILKDVERWLDDGRQVAVATVVAVDGSSPREIGAAMAVNDSGDVAGSVSGGCVEGALVEECQAVLAGAAPHVVTYGVSDDEAFAVGLTCGGTFHIFVERLDW
jgi:xanthine/CO dehydrogenase XdhC/CoxF family maturation factor